MVKPQDLHMICSVFKHLKPKYLKCKPVCVCAFCCCTSLVLLVMPQSLLDMNISRSCYSSLLTGMAHVKDKPFSTSLAASRTMLHGWMGLI